MPRRLATLVATASIAAIAPAVGGSPLGLATAQAKPCSAGWTHAVLGDGAHKCLRAGQFCAPRHESVYRSKRYTCKAGRLKRA